MVFVHKWNMINALDIFCGYLKA
uniref:Uncharacterized protein n=1 Tax=Arundo donax TaxID=35708 RepID=A0A0A9FUX5_ARUDO